MKQYLLFISLAFSLLSGCSHSGAEWQLAEALRLADDNRAELEAVLSYYSDDPIKLEAAKYLIANMPGHYSYADTTLVVAYSEAVDSILNSMKECSMYERKDSINACAEKMGVYRWKKVQDIHVITADYIIRNIDDAFKSWNDPWARHLTFEQFCEYLLPYKVDELQLLDDWRNRLKSHYSEVLSDMSKCDAYRNATLEAARRLSKSLGVEIHPNYNSVIDYPVMKFEVNAKVPCGSCDYYIPLALAYHRSHGIPLAHDFCPHWASRRLGHSWNVVLAENGRTMAFNGISVEPVMAANGISVSDGDMHNSMEKMAKVYRYTYAQNKQLIELNRKEKYVPALFRNVFIKDVTPTYMETADVCLNLRKHTHGTSTAYLAVYGDNDWYPIAFAPISKGKTVFKDMGRNIMYIALCFTPEGKKEILSEPFLLDFDGTVKPFSASGKKISMHLTRKYPVLEYVYKWLESVDSCEVQASNDNRFRQFETINLTSDTRAIGNEIDISDSIPPYRYWRFISLKEKSCGNIAEIYFYDNDGKPLQGNVIGTTESFEGRADRTREAAFDGNTLTYFESPDNAIPWIGMDFGHSINIARILYYPRNDGNSIEPNDEYELYYWKDNEWEKINRKRSQSNWVGFTDVPEGAIYLLRDITKGHEERIFTYDNGNQVWW